MGSNDESSNWKTHSRLLGTVVKQLSSLMVIRIPIYQLINSEINRH